jgi:hypothetical protein
LCLALQLRALDLHVSQIPDADSFAFTLPLRKLTKAVVITSYGMPSEDALVVKGWRFAAKHFGLAHKMIVSTVFFAFSDFNAEYSGYCQARAIAGLGQLTGQLVSRCRHQGLNSGLYSADIKASLEL